MSEATSMTPAEQVKHMCGLLKEYAEKLVTLRRQERDFALPSFGADLTLYELLAWWLDECQRMRKPLLAVVSSASQTLEHLPLDTFQSEELALRLAEIEVHLHHVLRRFHFWSDRVAKNKSLKSHIDPLRIAHGLPAEMTR